jgi:hypothetical protein
VARGLPVGDDGPAGGGHRLEVGQARGVGGGAPTRDVSGEEVFEGADAARDEVGTAEAPAGASR